MQYKLVQLVVKSISLLYIKAVFVRVKVEGT
jgi:hypothetical protein